MKSLIALHWCPHQSIAGIEDEEGEEEAMVNSVDKDVARDNVASTKIDEVKGGEIGENER